jgi:hypothetical protein
LTSRDSFPFRSRKSICASGKELCNFSIMAVDNTTSPINAVCMTRNFCTVQTYGKIGKNGFRA